MYMDSKIEEIDRDCSPLKFSLKPVGINQYKYVLVKS